MEDTEISYTEKSQASKESAKKQNWWKVGFFITLLLLVVILFSSGYLLIFSKQRIEVPQKEESQEGSEDYCSESCVLEDIVKNSPTIDIGRPGASGHMWSYEDSDFNWKREDGYVRGEVKGREIQLYDRYENPKLDFNSLNREISNILDSLGFTRNDSNSYSYDSFDSGPLINIIGFEKDEMKCLVEWRDFHEYFYQTGQLAGLKYSTQIYSIACGIYKESEDPLNELFEDDFDPEAKNKSSYSLDKIIGDFAAGSVRAFPCCSGASWIAKKENNRWNVILTLQEAPSCELVDKYQIPKDVVDNCYEDSENLRYGEIQPGEMPPERSPTP